jgi:hypothetical protein
MQTSPSDPRRGGVVSKGVAHAVAMVMTTAAVDPSARHAEGVTFCPEDWAALELLTLDSPDRVQVKRAVGRVRAHASSRVGVRTPKDSPEWRTLVVACALVNALESLRTRDWTLTPDGGFVVTRDVPRFRDGI